MSGMIGGIRINDEQLLEMLRKKTNPLEIAPATTRSIRFPTPLQQSAPVKPRAINLGQVKNKTTTRTVVKNNTMPVIKEVNGTTKIYNPTIKEEVKLDAIMEALGNFMAIMERMSAEKDALFAHSLMVMGQMAEANKPKKIRIEVG